MKINPLAKIVAVMCLGAVISGYAYAHHQANQIITEDKVMVETVHSGDTFNEVISHYYNYDVEKECWDEWQTKQKQINSHLFNNGRYLQVGDKIEIHCKVRIQK